MNLCGSVALVVLMSKVDEDYAVLGCDDETDETCRFIRLNVLFINKDAKKCLESRALRAISNANLSLFE